jgi:chromatin remodeling complex protein RSC6
MPRAANPALLQPYKLSPELEAVTGPGPMPRGQMIKKVWEYIKSNGLQDEKNKRMINADEKLKVLFGGKAQVSMFEMTKLLNVHLSKIA